MEYTARVKINLKEVKLIEELLKIEINKNKLTIESHNLIEYNEVLKSLLKKNPNGTNSYFRGYFRAFRGE